MLPGCLKITFRADPVASTAVTFHVARYLALLAVTLSLCACTDVDPPARELRLSGKTMGTVFNVSVVLAEGQSEENLPGDLPALLDKVSADYSTYDTDASISRFNRAESTDWLPTSNTFCRGLEEALALSERTAGKFDPSVGQLVELWGFGAQNRQAQPPSAVQIDAALETTGYRLLHTRCGKNQIRKDVAALRIDLSGYAKGLAVDLVARELESRGLKNFLIELGGEIQVRGYNAAAEKWRVAIETPSPSEREPYAALRLTDIAVATSGDYRNFYTVAGKRYSHAIDPQTGAPVTHRTAAVTVIDSDAASADALATALLVMGADTGFSYAEDQHIAAMFLVRDKTGLLRKTTAQFLPYLEQSK